jgi:hypothetical protein
MFFNFITIGGLISRPGRSLSRCRSVFYSNAELAKTRRARLHKFVFVSLLAIAGAFPLCAKDKWTEFNIGPFRVDTDGDPEQARQMLSRLEQTRWVLGGMLESKDLQATWPFRILLTSAAKGAGSGFIKAHGDYIIAIDEGSRLPLETIAKIFLESNTSRLPNEVESGLPELFAGLEAHGSRLTWAIPPAKPDLAWARMQLFATKPEYAGRFSIFLNNLRGGSLLTVAEANAFGKNSKVLEKEAAGNLAAGKWEPVTIAGRPLDPKRDLGEHTMDPALAQLYLADATLDSDPRGAEQAYKAAGNAGYDALAQEGIARVIMHDKGDPREYLDGAITAGSKNAWVYEQAAQTRPPAGAVGLLETAAAMNPRWWVPVAKQAELAEKPAEKQSLLIEACKLNPRSAELWKQLAELQTKMALGKAAQNSWIRAEDAAVDPKEKESIHAQRRASEEARLDAEDQARRDSTSTAKAEDDRLRNQQQERIKAAELRAAESNGDTDTADLKNVTPWWSGKDRPIEADLTRVDCLENQARLWLKNSSGKTLVLLVPDQKRLRIDGDSTELGCGAQQPERKLTLIYKQRIDRKLKTMGDVTAIHFE